jgi:hypothetical protein
MRSDQLAYNCSCSDADLLLTPTPCALLANEAKQELELIRRRKMVVNAAGDHSYDSGATGAECMVHEDQYNENRKRRRDEEDDDDDEDEDDSELFNAAEFNAIGTRAPDPWGGRDADLAERDEEQRRRLGLDAGDEEESRPYQHGYQAYNASAPGHLSDAPREQVKAAFAAMAEQGGSVSRDAREKSQQAESSGRASHHRQAASLHREAADEHEERGNDFLADAHRSAAKYHSRQARSATRNDIDPSNEAQRKAAFARMAEAGESGESLSRDAKRASRIADASGKARDHKAAAAAHREAADFHRDAGNDDVADAHRSAAKSHDRAAYHASRKGRAARNHRVSVIANTASQKAALDGTEASHLDAARALKIAAAGAAEAGDRTAVEVHYRSASLHENHAAKLHNRLVANSPLVPPSHAHYIGRAAFPAEAAAMMAGITVNAMPGTGMEDADMLPLPTMNYESFASPSFRR